MSKPQIHNDFYRDIYRINEIHARIDPLEDIQPMYSGSYFVPDSCQAHLLGRRPGSDAVSGSQPASYQ